MKFLLEISTVTQSSVTILNLRIEIKMISYKKNFNRSSFYISNEKLQSVLDLVIDLNLTFFKEMLL